jgi:hypothetical protein
VKRRELDLGAHHVNVGDARPERPQAQGARGAHALEAVDDLELPTLDEEAERADLAVTRKRPAHGLERRSVTQPQCCEALAELGEVDVMRRVVGVRHAADCTTTAASPAMLMRDTSPQMRRISL